MGLGMMLVIGLIWWAPWWFFAVLTAFCYVKILV